MWSYYLKCVLQDKINEYINPDQVDFVPDRQAADQTRKVIDVISLIQSGWDSCTSPGKWILFSLVWTLGHMSET